MKISMYGEAHVKVFIPCITAAYRLAGAMISKPWDPRRFTRQQNGRRLGPVTLDSLVLWRGGLSKLLLDRTEISMTGSLQLLAIVSRILLSLCTAIADPALCSCGSKMPEPASRSSDHARSRRSCQKPDHLGVLRLIGANSS